MAKARWHFEMNRTALGLFQMVEDVLLVQRLTEYDGESDKTWCNKQRAKILDSGRSGDKKKNQLNDEELLYESKRGCRQ